MLSIYLADNSVSQERRRGGRCDSGFSSHFFFHKTFVRRKAWYAYERAKQQKKARRKTILHLKELTTLDVWVFILIKKVIYLHMLE